MKNRVEVKNIVAVVVIIASFLIALALALITNSRETYWVAAHDLTPGHMIDSQDFLPSKVAFGKEGRAYLSGSQNPVGYSISKYVAAGEYLHQSALLEGGGEANVKLLSFAVAAPDLPGAIKIGDQINLYQVINDNGDGKLIPSQLVISGIYVVDMNRKSQNIGGAAIITVAIPNEFVERALNATRKGRMVVIANHG